MQITISLRYKEMNDKIKPKAERPIKITAHFVISRHRFCVEGG